MDPLQRSVDVVIAGAGPVGMAAAVELGHRGISSLVIERNDRVGYSPRAKTTNVRTREHLRRWGIADALREASPIPPDFPPNVVFATRMNGPILARFENAFNGSRQKNNLYSEEAQWVPQYVLEEVLRSHASSLPGVTIRFSAELEAFTQENDVVVCTCKDVNTGQVIVAQGSYLIGADGARSTVRNGIGSTLVGEASAFRNFNVVFRAPDLAAQHDHGPAIMYWMVNADVPSLLGPMDQDGLWYFIATKLPSDIDLATVDVADLIRRGTGIADLRLEVLHAEPWVARRLVADRYASGRVFLAGDACHLHPPFGGFGMNMGIGDAVDLGWKIAGTLQGWGGPDLLASYQGERRQVHERTIAESVINYAAVGNQLVRPGIEEPGLAGDATRREVGELIQATKLREFKTLGIVLGSRYDNSPIIVSDGTDPPLEHFMLYVPSACPGGLAPHLWLADGSSLYDHFGTGFTLLVTDPEADTRGLVAAAAELGVPLDVLVPDDVRLRTRYEARYVLIRPDQHVAWRGDAVPADARSLLECVTGRTAATLVAAAA